MPTIHHAREDRFGRYLDEFEIGDVFHHWPGKTVTEADDHLFCLLTLAASPLHIDRHYAEVERAAARCKSDQDRGGAEAAGDPLPGVLLIECSQRVHRIGHRAACEGSEISGHVASLGWGVINYPLS